MKLQQIAPEKVLPFCRIGRRPPVKRHVAGDEPRNDRVSGPLFVNTDAHIVLPDLLRWNNFRNVQIIVQYFCVHQNYDTSQKSHRL